MKAFTVTVMAGLKKERPKKQPENEVPKPPPRIARQLALAYLVERLIEHGMLTDFCHCFEAGLKNHVNRSGGTLGQVLKENLHNTAVGDLSAEIATVKSLRVDNAKPWNCHSVAESNDLVGAHDAISQIEAETEQLKALAKLFALVLSIRNQVSHNLDLTNLLCRDMAKGRRVLRWMLFSMMFPRYL